MLTTTIKLQDFACYSPTAPVTITMTKPVAVFYGHNGVGKSTIAKVIRHHVNPSLGSAGSSSITINGLAAPEFLIYDADYVEDNFHTKESIRGIFTLGKKTAEELDEIQVIETELQNNAGAIQTASDTLTLLDTDSVKALNNVKEATWVVKADYEKGPLRFCLEDHKLRADKVKLFQHLANVDKADGAILIEDLLQEAAEIDDETAAQKPIITIPEFTFGAVEQSTLPGSIVAGSSDSRLSALIATLKNEDWVRRGKGFLENDSNSCPFCQQSLPHDFSSEVSKLFDTAYEEQCDELTRLRDSYQSSFDAFSELLKSGAYQDDYVMSDMAFQNASKELLLVIERNLRELNSKVISPGAPVALATSADVISKWSELAAAIIARTIDYNARISNRAKVKEGIDRRFWRKMKHEHSPSLLTYEQEIDRIKKGRAELEVNLESLKLESQQKNTTLRQLRASSTNIHASVDAINQRIRNIGIQGFSIEKDAKLEGYYHIARGTQGKVSYKSLSEGEKTLVTFLYFIESLEGSHNSDGNANKSNRIVVVDDPVSSLSHNHVYDIASLITINLIESKAFPQIIILTHSLFFYHELFKAVREREWKNYQCFRITKSEFSEICEMKHDDIRNDYQSYWLVLKEGIANHKYSVAIPIAMRYILEHYFSFVGYHEKLREALMNLGDNDQSFRAFYRYINRNSHSDDINITDLPSIDPSIYVQKFRQVFVDTQQLQHFNHMIGTEDEQVAA